MAQTQGIAVFWLRVLSVMFLVQISRAAEDRHNKDVLENSSSVDALLFHVDRRIANRFPHGAEETRVPSEVDEHLLLGDTSEETPDENFLPPQSSDFRVREFRAGREEEDENPELTDDEGIESEVELLQFVPEGFERMEALTGGESTESENADAPSEEAIPAPHKIKEEKDIENKKEEEGIENKKEENEIENKKEGKEIENKKEGKEIENDMHDSKSPHYFLRGTRKMQQLNSFSGPFIGLPALQRHTPDCGVRGGIYGLFIPCVTPALAASNYLDPVRNTFLSFDPFNILRNGRTFAQNTGWT